MPSNGIPDFPEFPDRTYKTFKADPPWPYEDSLPGDGRGAESHYETLSLPWIEALAGPIHEVTAQNAHCYLWTTASFLEDAHSIMRAWGFEPKQVLTWVKVRHAREDLPHERDAGAYVRPTVGMGQKYRNAAEFLLFGVKGSLNLQRRDLRSVFFAPATEHSTKPEKSYRLAEQASPGPRLELFARQERSGWDAWGDEIDGEAPPRPTDDTGELPNPEEW